MKVESRRQEQQPMMYADQSVNRQINVDSDEPLPEVCERQHATEAELC